MRLLYASMQLPWPLDNGGKFALFSDLKSFARYFQIDVLSFVDCSLAGESARLLFELNRRLPSVRFLDPVPHPILPGSAAGRRPRTFLQALLRGEPYVVAKYRSASYLRRAEELVQQQAYDAVVVEGLSPASVLDALARLRSRPRIIYRAYDIFFETTRELARQLSPGATKLAATMDAVVCRRFEKSIWRRADRILAITRAMATRIGDMEPEVRERLSWLPVAIDEAPRAETSRGTSVLYVGTVHYPPNLAGLRWFLEECWPLVLRSAPDARLDIVGRGGDRLHRLPPGVVVHDYVDDLDNSFASAAVFVVPLKAGSGLRLKILDAMNRGVPVVSTTIGYEGIEALPGRDLLVADDAAGFARHVVDLLARPALRVEISSQGRRLVAEQHGELTVERAMRAIAGSLAIAGPKGRGNL
jgi:glycosyltransferase involved in cell wall biosynthesis